MWQKLIRVNVVAFLRHQASALWTNVDDSEDMFWNSLIYILDFSHTAIQKVSDLKMRIKNRHGLRVFSLNMVGFPQILAQSLLKG